jgi:hypothetical protein
MSDIPILKCGEPSNITKSYTILTFKSLLVLNYFNFNIILEFESVSKVPRLVCGIGKPSEIKPADEQIQEIVDLVNCLNYLSKKYLKNNKN